MGRGSPRHPHRTSKCLDSCFSRFTSLREAGSTHGPASGGSQGWAGGPDRAARLLGCWGGCWFNWVGCWVGCWVAGLGGCSW